MARGLSDKQKTILKVIYDFEQAHPWVIGRGTDIHQLYTAIKDKLYTPSRYHYRYVVIHWDYKDPEYWKYKRGLSVMRATISRAIKGLIKRGLLVKIESRFIYLSQKGKEFVRSNIFNVNT